MAASLSIKATGECSFVRCGDGWLRHRRRSAFSTERQLLVWVGSRLRGSDGGCVGISIYCKHEQMR